MSIVSQVTDSNRGRRSSGKRERLVAAATTVLHQQGVEKTTLADIATAAGVPVGNVYYYFKTKDQLVEAAIGAQEQTLATLLADLDTHRTPKSRLKSLLGTWSTQRDLAARYGCPTGTLASELDKCADGLDQEVAKIMRTLLTWLEAQFREMGRRDAPELAVALLSAYQGISLLTNTFRAPEMMATEIHRLERWIDSLD